MVATCSVEVDREIVFVRFERLFGMLAVFGERVGL